MAFKFRLEKVLEYRKQLEERAMQALAAAQAARDAEASRLAGLKRDLAAQMERTRDAAAMNGAERWLNLNCLEALRQDIKRSTALLSRLEEDVALRRDELAIKAQERGLLDKLKDKQARCFAEDEKLREQRDYDETATIRHNKENALQTV